MDVIAEEHPEDLQIAGVGSGDSASDDSTNVLSWFAHRQYWVVVWGIASCIMEMCIRDRRRGGPGCGE